MEEFDRRNEELCHNATEANSFANILGPINNNMGHLLYVLLAVIGARLSLRGVPNVSLSGAGGPFTLGMHRLLPDSCPAASSMPISQVSQQLNTVVMALAGAERIFQPDGRTQRDRRRLRHAGQRQAERTASSTKATAVPACGPGSIPISDGTVTYTELKGDVRLDDVDFGYDAGQRWCSTTSAFTPSRARRSPLSAPPARARPPLPTCINRFYDIADGKIRYDGININKIKKPICAARWAWFCRTCNLFTGTVMENIRYGNLDATDEECIAAAEAGQCRWLHPACLPEGYDTMLTGDGSGLSQGQRQLISIARAAVADPPVMILDEATSSIDTRTESIWFRRAWTP